MELEKIPFKNFSPAMRVPIIDERSYENAEIEQLLVSLPTISEIGRSALRSNMTSAVDENTVRAKQDAVAYLIAHTDVRERTQEAISSFADGEEDLSAYLKGVFDVYQGRAIYRNGRAGTADAIKRFTDIPDQETTPKYFKNLLGKLRLLDDTESGDLLRRKVYLTAAGIKGPGSNWRHAPRLGFSGRAFTGRSAAIFGLGLYSSRHGIIPESAGMGVAMASMYGMMNVVLPVIHFPLFMMPVRQKLLKNHDFVAGLESLAELDALQALAQAALDSTQPMVRPTIAPTQSGHHVFLTKGLSNPLLALQNNHPEVVRNDAAFDNERLTFLTGPNSGGKSTLSKAIVYNQLLAHAGSHVSAESAQISVADKVVYHIPAAPDLGAEVGRFEYELGIVKPHFETATPNSLVVLDDCLDGTTHEERVAQLKNLMLGFLAVGSTTIFSTHAHELAEMFESKALGQFMQVEFDKATDKPTYRIKPGVSHTSHADNVAQRLGLDQAGIAASLHDRGIQAVTWA